MKRNDPDYMRQYRAKHGGSAPSDKARSRANAAAAKWVYDNHPELYSDFLMRARLTLGLPVEEGPSGNFTKPIEHGTIGGYNAHLYRKETPCNECRIANRAYSRDRYRSRIS